MITKPYKSIYLLQVVLVGACLAEMSEMIIAEWLVEVEGASRDNL